MKNLTIKTILAGISISAALVSGAALAQEKTDAYVVDTRSAVVKDPYNLCWRTGYWTPAMAIAECDPDLVKKPEPKAAEPKPEPKAEPKAEPVVTPPPVKLAPEKVTFSADALFDFDKAVLRPDGKQVLDQFAGKLRGVKYEVIIAIGHADRIGSAAYNKKLSIRRAEAVKAYLVNDKGIPANRIYTDGKGESDPMTKAGDCKGTKATKALIACLQPDRRVEVEVAGTREVK